MHSEDAPPKILIADDAEILNNMLKDVFEEQGFEVYQAFDGAECKLSFLKNRPDLAFIDIQMPKADGIEALRFIKQREPRTIVVMMTGVGNESLAVKSMKLGAADYITKPFGTDDVVQLAQKLIETRRTGEETSKLRNQIRRTERYLAHLTTIINESLVTTNALGKIQFVNQAGELMWGYSLDELLNRDIHFLVSGEGGAPLHRDLVRDTIKKGKIDGEFQLRRKNKTTFPAYLSTSVISDSGKVRGIVMLATDLSRINEIERKLKQSEKMAALGKVVEGIAHEVRNCLTSLGGFTRRLQKALSETPNLNQYTKIILEDVERLERMVKDIEEYVRFSKFYKFNYRKSQLAEIIKKAHARVLDHLPTKPKSVQFLLKSENEIPEIYADTEAMEEIFFHLIKNSYEAMQHGGKLLINLKPTVSNVEVTVSDNGCGIPESDISEIFNPFFTSKTTGAGMGLSKVYLLVEEHGGVINVNSQTGKGTTFRLKLPIEKPLLWNAKETSLQ